MYEAVVAMPGNPPGAAVPELGTTQLCRLQYKAPVGNRGHASFILFMSAEGGHRRKGTQSDSVRGFPDIGSNVGRLRRGFRAKVESFVCLAGLSVSVFL